MFNITGAPRGKRSAIGLALAMILTCASPSSTWGIEPTAEETLMVEYLNRFRADPAADALRIAPENGPPPLRRVVDYNMFRREVTALKPAAPLVINLHLLKAARSHSRYLLLNNTIGHDQEPSLPGFTGQRPSDRMKWAGYTGLGGENVATRVTTPWKSHQRFIIDAAPPDGPGGMQPRRGHRMNMINETYREVGMSFIDHQHRQNEAAVVHNLGRGRDVPRFCGGVIYHDKNQNNFYDLGEGISGVKIIASDGTTTRTWRSGGYTLELKSTGPVHVRAQLAGVKHTLRFPKGSDNIKFDWIAKPSQFDSRVDKLLHAVQRHKDKPKKRPYIKAVIALYLGTANLPMTTQRQKQIDKLTHQIRKDLTQAQKQVIDALKQNDSRQFTKTWSTQRKPWRGTLADRWFTSAKTAYRLQDYVSQYERMGNRKQRIRDRARKQLQQELGQLLTAVNDPTLREHLTGLLDRVEKVGRPATSAR